MLTKTNISPSECSWVTTLISPGIFLIFTHPSSGASLQYNQYCFLIFSLSTYNYNNYRTGIVYY